MPFKEKLFYLFAGLNEHDQRIAYEFLESLVDSKCSAPNEKKEVNILGRDYFVVHD